MKNLILKATQVLTLLMFSTLMLSAQKLPDTQQRSVTIPADAKIDGTISEWNNKLVAYNKSTEIYYTLAHDKQNLYLAIQATDAEIIKKIMRGGITFTICTSGQRTDPNPLTVTFPVMPVDYQRGVNLLLTNLTTALKNNGNIDSASYVFNRLIASGEKQIKVKGFKSISDSLVSINNNLGMKAIGLIDNKAVFTCELMVPLELMGQIAGKEIAYHIILSGEPAVVRKVNPLTTVTVTRTSNASTTTDLSLMYPTDFWGKYKLTD